jgi:hypothetical protein
MVAYQHAYQRNESDELKEASGDEDDRPEDHGCSVFGRERLLRGVVVNV